jgi:hypothetical protein
MPWLSNKGCRPIAIHRSEKTGVGCRVTPRHRRAIVIEGTFSARKKSAKNILGFFVPNIFSLKFLWLFLWLPAVTRELLPRRD